MRSHPIGVFELVPTPPAYLGQSEASTSWGAEASINLLELLTILFQWLVLKQAAPIKTLRHASVAG
jgi:hypothetical protein